MIARDNRVGRTPPLIEIGFYVLLMVVLVYAAFLCVSYISRKQDETKKIATNQMKKLVEPAEKELKEMDQETTPVTPVAPLPPPVAQPAVAPQQYQRPTPLPMVSYQYTPPPSMPPQYGANGQQLVPSVVAGAGTY